MRYTLAWYVISIAPYLMLAYGGALLWNSLGRLPAVLVGGGFSTAALSQMAGAYVSVTLWMALDSSERLGPIMATLAPWQWLAHLGPLGMWVAAAGLLAHALREAR